MNENRSWQELHTEIRKLREKLEYQKTATKTFSRINYGELLGILRNFSEFQHNRKIQVKINCQDGIMTVQLIKKGD